MDGRFPEWIMEFYTYGVFTEKFGITSLIKCSTLGDYCERLSRYITIITIRHQVP